MSSFPSHPKSLIWLGAKYSVLSPFIIFCAFNANGVGEVSCAKSCGGKDLKFCVDEVRRREEGRSGGSILECEYHGSSVSFQLMLKLERAIDPDSSFVGWYACLTRLGTRMNTENSGWYRKPWGNILKAEVYEKMLNFRSSFGEGRVYRTWWEGEVAKLRAREMGPVTQIQHDPRQERQAASKQSAFRALPYALEK
jgi:hypothetical protein